jgi:lysophospholipase L1-like esterase
MVSDAAALKVAALSDVAVSLFVPDQVVTIPTYHASALSTQYMVAGNAVGVASLTDAKTNASWYFLKGIDVQADSSAGAVVAFGDSITDGARSTKDKNARWPDVLAARLQADKKTAKLGVINEGIGGNRILNDVTGPSALARFDRDVLAQDGVKYLVILEAINDIGHMAVVHEPHDVVTADQLIAGYTQMIERAHVHGIRVIGATLTPYIGAKYQNADGEVMRETLNQWIRTTKMLDGVVDFDKATADPAKAGVFLPADDGGDHLHPSDAGYKAMGESIDLKLFTK